MKILCFADMHFDENPNLRPSPYRKVFDETAPDMVLIAGDVFENFGGVEPYEWLGRLFPGTPVVFVLGNHEFYFRTPARTLEFYKRKYAPEKWDVHCLDIIGQYNTGNVRFVGNMLGYDGSLADVPGQNLNDFADGMWPDKHIEEWDFKSFCGDCQRKIVENRSDSPGVINILLTHTVPHKRLNLHPALDEFNAYSGVSDFLDRHKFAHAVSADISQKLRRTDHQRMQMRQHRLRLQQHPALHIGIVAFPLIMDCTLHEHSCYNARNKGVVDSPFAWTIPIFHFGWRARIRPSLTHFVQSLAGII